MRRLLTPSDLDLVNLVLARDPAMAEALLGKVDALNAALGPVALPEPASAKRPTDVPEVKSNPVAVWVKANVPAEGVTKETVKSALTAQLPGPKFNTAFDNALSAGLIKTNGKRGPGTRYLAG
jgi:hypothetical protein